MTGETLAVLLRGTHIGFLERPTERDDPSFTYTADYVRDGSVSLSARLPLQNASFPPDRVMPYLMGLVPESVEARERWARQLQVPPDDAFSMLATMGWDCPGAVQFCRPDQMEALEARGGEFMAVDDAAIADRIRSLSRASASWTMPEEHWSLGGQQEKFALAHIDGRWHEAHGSAPTTHIIKPGIARLHHQALVEHLTMRAAALVGIDVAETQFLPFDKDTWALVVERFDRTVDEQGAILRVHQEDFAQALGRRPEHKYEARGGPTARDMVGLVQRESTDLVSDRLALADFLIINVVAGAPDGHAKNIALIRGRGGSVIAPLYDLATGLAYDARTVDRSAALSVGGERWASRMYARQWDKAAALLRVDAEAMRRRVAQLATDFPAAFEAAISEARDAPGIEDVAERTLARLEDHCAGILARL